MSEGKTERLRKVINEHCINIHYCKGVGGERVSRSFFLIEFYDLRRVLFLYFLQDKFREPRVFERFTKGSLRWTGDFLCVDGPKSLQENKEAVGVV